MAYKENVKNDITNKEMYEGRFVLTRITQGARMVRMRGRKEVEENSIITIKAVAG